MFRYSLVLAVGLCLAGSVSANSWADGLFDELNKDFGSVPRGPMLTHPFHLVNKTKVPVNISGVRVSCGCTTATALKGSLAPGEDTVVLAQMDTRRFSGVKTVTIYVTFDRPNFEEVRLWVQANSRDDVSVSPESLAFGMTKRGSGAAATVNVSFMGNSGSQILEVTSDSNYVATSVKEVRRQESDVAYELTARLRPEAPVGKWYTDIWLKTNNGTMPRVRVPLTVEIESALSISPATVTMGEVKVGAQAERKVVIRGVKPFKITDVKGTDDSALVRDSSTDSKPVHVLTLTLKGTQAGEINKTFRVITDMKDEAEIEFQAKAQIMP
jgi:hypothetical protein